MGFTTTRGRPRKCTESRHKWIATHKVDGGIEDRPGIYGLGGSMIAIHDHCKHCGQKRHKVGSLMTLEYEITYPEVCD